MFDRKNVEREKLRAAVQKAEDEKNSLSKECAEKWSQFDRYAQSGPAKFGSPEWHPFSQHNYMIRVDALRHEAYSVRDRFNKASLWAEKTRMELDKFDKEILNSRIRKHEQEVFAK